MHFSQLAGNRARGDGRAFGLRDSHALGDVKQSYFHQLFLPQRKIHMIRKVRTVACNKEATAIKALCHRRRSALIYIKKNTNSTDAFTL